MIAITSHNDNDNITNEADNFTPSGFLDDFPLGTVTLTDSNNNVITPLSIAFDITVLMNWSAQFPTLASGVYLLHVEDSPGTSTASIQGLTVD